MKFICCFTGIFSPLKHCRHNVYVASCSVQLTSRIFCDAFMVFLAPHLGENLHLVVRDCLCHHQCTWKISSQPESSFITSDHRLLLIRHGTHPHSANRLSTCPDQAKFHPHNLSFYKLYILSPGIGIFLLVFSLHCQSFRPADHVRIPECVTFNFYW